MDSESEGASSANNSGKTRIRAGVEVACLSDIGCERKNNEDFSSYWEPADEDSFRRKGRLAVVADGMGGYEGGENASRIAVESIIENYSQLQDGDPDSWLEAGFQAAHRRIVEYAAQHPRLHGMGTTCTAVALVGSKLFYGHLGDSRLYLLHGDSFSRLTRDHSYVGRLVERGVITSEQAESHPQRHVLTAALGAGLTISPEHADRAVTLAANDVLMLCTDGLWGLVSDDEIQAALAAGPAAACKSLVALARERGGPDNITLLIVAIKS